MIKLICDRCGAEERTRHIRTYCVKCSTLVKKPECTMCAYNPDCSTPEYIQNRKECPFK